MSEASEWRVTTLGECARWYSGGTPDTSNPAYWNGDIPWITASSLHNFYVQDSERKVTAAGLENGTRLMPEGSILFVVRGMSLKTEFRVGIAKRPVAFGQDCKAIIAKPGMDPLFLAYAILGKRGEILGLVDEASHGTGRLQTEALMRVEVRVPPLPEQRRIAHILGTLDDKIELNRRMNATLEAMARALFTSWFVNFDPVRARAEDRDPGLPADVAALFPASFVDSELGAIPAGWEVLTVGDLARTNARTLTPSDPLSTIAYIEISEVSKGNVANVQQYERGQEPSRARRRLRHGDTALSTVRPDRESYFLCLDPAENLLASTGFAVFTPDRAPWSFVHSMLTQPEVFTYLGRHADGGAYPAVRPNIIEQWQVAWPPEQAIVDAYHRTASPFYERAAANRQQSVTLAALRDTLLPKLLSGELRVPAAESEVKHVQPL